MKTIEVKEAISTLSEYTKDVCKEPLVLTEKGKPVAVLVSVQNADLETVSLSNNPNSIDLIERSRTRQKTESGISPANMRKRLKI